MAYRQQNPLPHQQNRPQMSQIPEMKDDVGMWNSPMDSGFTSQLSGVQTPALSVFDEDAHAMNYEWDQQPYQDDRQPTNSQLHNDPQMQIQTSVNVSHMSTPNVYYSEAMDDAMSDAPPQMPDLLPVNSQNPSQNPPQNNNSNSNNDTPYDNARKHIPELIGLLQDDDPVIVGQAFFMIHQLSKNPASKDAVIESSQQLLVTIFRTIIHSEMEFAVFKLAVAVVNHISQEKIGAEAILNSDGIRVLLNLLTSPHEPILSYALTTLHNILLNCKETSRMIIQAEGIPKIVALLQRDNAKLLFIVTDCIQLLTIKNPEAKLQVLKLGGTIKLLHIMRTYDYEKLLSSTVRVLKVLSVCQQNKPVIVKSGGMEALSMHLTHKSDRLTSNCLLTIRNLSDCATKIENMAQLTARNLIYLLTSSNETFATYAAECLSNLTCNNPMNKSIIFQEGGVEELIKIITRYSNKDEIVEPAVCTLRHLTSGQAGLAVAENNDIRTFGLPVFISLLEPQRSWPVVNAVIGLTRNLALSFPNKLPLREHGAIVRLVELLKKADIESRTSPTSGGVRMNHIIEGTVGTLLTLAEDRENRAMIRSLAVVPIFVQLLYSNTPVIQGVSVGVLHKLTNDTEGVQMIHQSAGAITALRQLLNSPNDGIKNYASECLSRLQQQLNRENMFANSMDMNSPMFSRNMDNQHWNGPGMDEVIIVRRGNGRCYERCPTTNLPVNPQNPSQNPIQN